MGGNYWTILVQHTPEKKNYFLAGGAPCSIGGGAAPMAKGGPGKPLKISVRIGELWHQPNGKRVAC